MIHPRALRPVVGVLAGVSALAQIHVGQDRRWRVFATNQFNNNPKDCVDGWPRAGALPTAK
jgi:hypothetical protein